MGRPRTYGSEAERQRAYRERLEAETVRVDRRALERLHDRLDRLHTALYEAAKANEPSAQAGRSASVETMLEKLTQYFEGCVEQRATTSRETASNRTPKARQSR